MPARSGVERRGLLRRHAALPNPRRDEAERLSRQRAQRIVFLMAIASAMMLFIAYRFVMIQVVERDEVILRFEAPYLEMAPDFEEAPPRGAIRDRNGFLMATDSTLYRLSVSPNIMSDPDGRAEEVAAITGHSVDELRDLFTGDEQHLPVARDLSFEQGQQIAALKEVALILEPQRRRAYPEGTLAAQLLGFANAEGVGQNGVELYYDELLTSAAAPPASEQPRAQEILLNHRSFMPSESKNDLILTIDRSIQFMAEQELQTAIEQYQATGGTIVVMEPRTGDVLAMANAPSFDPNLYYDERYQTDPTVFNNPAIFKQYEPGSVFKLITMAAALDVGAVTPETVYNDVGVIEVGGGIIRNWNEAANGSRTMTEVLGLSLNTGTAWVSTQLGADRLYPYIEQFGFGEPTGIDLGAEASGMVKKPPEMLPDPLLPPWHPSDLGTNSFGQGISVTPIQMISAVASLLNGGELMQPRVVRAVVEHGVLRELEPVVRGQSVSAETAATMREMMTAGVEMETKLALLDGWRVGGKTGTAQVPVEGGYHPTDTIASFIGFAPADDPAFIILIKLDRPLGDFQWGGQSAAPTFKQLAQRILTYYNIPPDARRMARPALEGEEAEQAELVQP